MSTGTKIVNLTDPLEMKSYPTDLIQLYKCKVIKSRPRKTLYMYPVSGVAVYAEEVTEHLKLEFSENFSYDEEKELYYSDSLDPEDCEDDEDDENDEENRQIFENLQDYIDYSFSQLIEVWETRTEEEREEHGDYMEVEDEYDHTDSVRIPSYNPTTDFLEYETPQPIGFFRDYARAVEYLMLMRGKDRYGLYYIKRFMADPEGKFWEVICEKIISVNGIKCKK